MSPINLTTSEARQAFAETLGRARRGERILLSAHGKAVAAIVSPEDLELLRRLDDLTDLRAARRAKADVERDGAIPWDRVKADVGR